MTDNQQQNQPQQTTSQQPQQTTQTAQSAPKYMRLAEAIKSSKQPTAYYRQFLRAAAEGKITGVIMLADSIKLSPARKGGKVREVRDYAILPGSGFTEWHNAEIAKESSKVTTKSAPSFADIVAGKVDIRAAQTSTAEMLSKQAARLARAEAKKAKSS